MNINKPEILSQIQSRLTYNGNNIQIPKDNKLNIFMGIGLWSAKNGLSIGLPVDVIQMLLSAATLRSQIKEVNSKKPSTIILLIADSLAIHEGADKEKVSQLISLYKKSLEPLLALLNIKECSDIILSSDLEEAKEYQETLRSVEQTKALQELREDKDHYAYIHTQTAITHYMHTHRDVGVKVGWICTDSSEQLSDNKIKPKSLKREHEIWDELKFDRICKAVCQNSTIQYLYTKAGLKQPQNNKGKLCVIVSEGCPYTAYKKDQRYVIQVHDQSSISAICPLQKKVASHWKDVAEACSNLIQLKVVNDRILPVDCIKKSNNVVTVYNMLNYWSNILTLSLKAEADIKLNSHTEATSDHVAIITPY